MKQIERNLEGTMVFDMTEKEQLWYLISGVLNGVYDIKTFCSEFTRIYDLEIDYDHSYGYSDSDSDLPMLELCRYRYRVDRKDGHLSDF